MHYQLPTGVSTVRPSLDFETYSEAGYVIDHQSGKVTSAAPGKKGGLPLVGTPNYACHPTADIICLYYDLKDGQGVRGWMPGTPPPADLLAYVAAGGDVEAFNVTFEWWAWNMIAVRRYGWPPLRLDQCHCVMARSRRYSMPGSLGNLAKVLGTAQKDAAGHNLIQRLTRPHTLTKTRRAYRRTPATDWPDFAAMYSYCADDVRAEDAAAAYLPDLTPFEREWWLADQRINARGVQVDVDSLDAMLDILGQTTAKYTRELQELTGGAVGSVSEVAKILEWLAGRGVYLPDLTADTVKDALKSAAQPGSASYRVLEIRQALGSANVKKLATLRLQVSGDGRLRDQYTCWGADRTGRWSSGGVQLQNLTAKGPATDECGDCGAVVGYDRVACCPECGSMALAKRPDWDVVGAEYALRDIAHRSADLIEAQWGNPIDVLCGCLRALLTAKPGHDLVCADFSAVEAVAAACLSRCHWRIDVFSTHGKIYEMSAAKISGTPFEDIIGHKQTTGQHHPLRKTLGKVAELASGYGGWISAWQAFGADAFMSEDEIKAAILKWREESPEIVEMWGGQFRQTGPRLSDGHPELFGLEGAAVAAILSPGQWFRYIDIAYAVLGDVLCCRLPSGRLLHYHRPRLVAQPGKWGKPDSWRLTFEGYNSNPTKGPVGWQVMETYGGRLFENVVQAVCADIQAEAILRLERAGYPVVMHTHDEATAEVPEGWGSVHEMEAIMAERPAWCHWWPLRSAGWRHKRYQKD